MNFVSKGTEYYFTGLKREDIKFTNMEGRLTGSVYDNPNKPQHSIDIWLDGDSAAILPGSGANVRVKVIEHDGITEEKSYIKLNAYPKMRQDKFTGAEVQYPKFVLRCGDNRVSLTKESFREIDTAHYRDNIEKVDIAFHLYEAYGRQVTCIDEVWLTIKDEGLRSAGGSSINYLEELNAKDVIPCPPSYVI